MKQFLLKNRMGVFWIGFAVTFLDNTIGTKHVFTILGGILMLFSFYLRYLKSKQNKPTIAFLTKSTFSYFNGLKFTI